MAESFRSPHFTATHGSDMRTTYRVYACTVALALVLAVGAASPLTGQPYKVPDCEAAERILVEGGSIGSLERAASSIPRCRDRGGRALARALRVHAHSYRVALLDTITGAAAQLRDAAVYESALEVAGSVNSSPPARVFAFRTLLYSLNPLLRFTYAELSGVGEKANCSGHSATTHDLRHWTGARFPADYGDRIRELARRVSADPATPDPVRRAAFCATLHREYPWRVSQPVDEPALIVRPKARP